MEPKGLFVEKDEADHINKSDSVSAAKVFVLITLADTLML